MEIIELDDIRFRLQQRQDFRWLKRYGRAFWCVDQTGSGCICIGMEQAGEKVFCKIAGVGTVEAEVSPEEYERGAVINERTTLFTLGAAAWNVPHERGRCGRKMPDESSRS